MCVAIARFAEIQRLSHYCLHYTLHRFFERAPFLLFVLFLRFEKCVRTLCDNMLTNIVTKQKPKQKAKNWASIHYIIYVIKARQKESNLFPLGTSAQRPKRKKRKWVCCIVDGRDREYKKETLSLRQYINFSILAVYYKFFSSSREYLYFYAYRARKANYGYKLCGP